MRKEAVRGFGIALVIGGIVLLLFNSFGITGFVVVEDISRVVKSITGFVLVVGGVILLIFNREESGLEESVKDAVKKGVPHNNAISLIRESNKKVETGEWVEIGIENVTTTVHNQPEDKEMNHPFYQGTSLCRYWGSKEYKGCSRSKLYKLYDEGKIGKTHEIVRGSDVYPLTGKGSERQGTLSRPGPGSRVLHRHWEIEQMYRRQTKETS